LFVAEKRVCMVWLGEDIGESGAVEMDGWDIRYVDWGGLLREEFGGGEI